MLGMSIVLKKGIYDPANKDKDAFDVAAEELKYVAEKLGIPWK